MKSLRVMVIICFLLALFSTIENLRPINACESINCPVVKCPDDSCATEFVYCAGSCPEEGDECIREIGTC